MIESQVRESNWPHWEWNAPSSENYQQSRILVNARKSELANWIYNYPVSEEDVIR